MIEKVDATSTAKLRIIMKRNYAGFGEKERQEFLLGLSKVTGYPFEDISSNAKFRKGCVIFEIDLPEQVVRTFIEMYEQTQEENVPSELTEFVSFIKKELR